MDAPKPPRELPGLAPLASPREAISHFVAEVCRDLESSKIRLSAVDSVDQLIAAATETHTALVDHGQTMGQYVRILQDWRQDAK